MKKRLFLTYPYLFGLYPIVALFAYNVTEIDIFDGLRALILSLVFAILLNFALRLFVKDWMKSSLVTTLTIILFFVYGHLYNLLRYTTILGMQIFRHRVLGLIFLGVFALGTWWIMRRIHNPAALTAPLNAIAAIALAFPLYSIISYRIQFSRPNPEQTPVESLWIDVQGDQQLPDVYYIILDEYSRDDYLLEGFNYDNTPFLNALEERGFFIAYCSQSNYSQTRLSLVTSLNMNYLETFYNQTYQVNELDVDRYKRGMIPFIKSSRVRKTLESLGYKTVAFETGFDWTELEDAYIYLTPEDRTMRLNLFEGVNEFEAMMIRSTGLLFLSATSPRLADILLPNLDYPNKIHRNRVLFILESLENLPSNQIPKFVFAHIVSPHKPFVFGPNGEVLDRPPMYRIGYLNQIKYLNKRFLRIIDEILKNSNIPPIIILQADHGALQHVGETGRLGILNAYYLPNGGDRLLYSGISPVNTFRVVFNTYFGQDLEMLEDISYKSIYTDPTNYQIIPNTRQGCEQ